MGRSRRVRLDVCGPLLRRRSGPAATSATRSGGGRVAREHKYVSNSIQSLHRFNITPNAGTVEPLAVMEVILHLWQVSHTHQQAVSHTHTFDSSLCFTRPGRGGSQPVCWGVSFCRMVPQKPCSVRAALATVCQERNVGARSEPPKPDRYPKQCTLFSFVSLSFLSSCYCFFLFFFFFFFCVPHSRHTDMYVCVLVQLSKDTRFLRCFRLQQWSEDYPALQTADSCCFVPFTSGATTKVMVKPRYWQHHVPHQSHTAP